MTNIINNEEHVFYDISVTVYSELMNEIKMIRILIEF